MNLLVTGSGRSGTKALQLYLTLALLQEHQKVQLNYEPYLWKTRKGRFSFEGVRHLVASVCFPTDRDQLSRRHHRYFERMVASEIPTITKCIRGLGRMSFLKDTLEADVWIHVVRDLYDVLDSLERQEWNLYETGPPIFPFPKIDLWPKYLKESQKLPVPKEIRAAIIQAKTEMEKNAVCWYLDNLAVLSAERGPDVVLPFEDLQRCEGQLLEHLGMKTSDMPVSFTDIHGRQLRKDDWLVDATTNISHWDDLKHSWNEWIFRRRLPSTFLLSEEIGQRVRLNQIKPVHTAPAKDRPPRVSLPGTDFLNRLNEEIKFEV